MVPNHEYIKTVINIKQGWYQTKELLRILKTYEFLQLALLVKLKLIIF